MTVWHVVLALAFVCYVAAVAMFIRYAWADTVEMLRRK